MNKSLRPIILDLDEPLKSGEEMVGIKTIGLESEEGRTLIGYVAIIKNFTRFNELRYGNLKASLYNKRELSQSVL